MIDVVGRKGIEVKWNYNDQVIVIFIYLVIIIFIIIYL